MSYNEYYTGASVMEFHFTEKAQIYTYDRNLSIAFLKSFTETAIVWWNLLVLVKRSQYDSDQNLVKVTHKCSIAGHIKPSEKCSF